MNTEQSLAPSKNVPHQSTLAEESSEPSGAALEPVVTLTTSCMSTCDSVVQCHSDDEEAVKSKTSTSTSSAVTINQDDASAGPPEGMSKNQWKKMKRLQRREEAYKRKKEDKRQLRQQLIPNNGDGDKKKRKRELAIETKDSELAEPKRKKFKLMSDDGASSIKVAIDFGFEDLMTDKDIKMLMKQCQRCYAQNRRAAAPLQFYWTSFSGRCKKRMDDVVPSYKGWDIHVCSSGYVDEFGKDNVVFLTSDSTNILEDLDTSKCYVIGGLVDHNHYKGYCHRKAEELGVSHAQLPISKFIEMNSRKVLAVNHVFEILLSYSTSRDWKKAFYDVIPERKLTTR